MVNNISKMVTSIFSFFKQQTNSVQQTAKYNLRRRKRLKKATNTAEQIIYVVDSIITRYNTYNIPIDKELIRLKLKYKKLVNYFNLLD